MMRWVWGYGRRKVFLETDMEGLAYCQYLVKRWEIYIFKTQLYLPCPDYTDPNVAPLEYAEALVRLSIPDAK